MKRILAVGALAAALVGSNALASEIDLGDRIGKIQCAEMSSAPITVYDLEKSPHPIQFGDTRCIVVTVKLLGHRSINIVDYKLTLNGEELSCIALARDDESFVVNAQTIYATGRDRIRMLYLADGAKFAGAGNSLEGTLSTRLPGRNAQISVPVTNRGAQALTKTSAISPEGNF